MKVFVIIPAYNEASKIVEVLGQVKQHCKNIVVIDDGSTDNTLQKLMRVQNITVLSHCINRGQGASLRTGTEYALQNGADILVHFDADGQMDSSEIKKLVRLLIQEKVDVVKGSRFLGKASNIPFTRKLVNKAGAVFTFFVSGIKVTDPHNGFRVLNRSAAKQIRITQDKMAHASEIIDEIKKKNLKLIETPVTVKYTEYSLQKGQSSLNFISICFNLFLNKFTKVKT